MGYVEGGWRYVLAFHNAGPSWKDERQVQYRDKGTSFDARERRSSDLGPDRYSLEIDSALYVGV